MKPDELAGALNPPNVSNVSNVSMPGTALTALHEWIVSQGLVDRPSGAGARLGWEAAVKWCSERADQIAASFSEHGAPDRAYGARAVAKHLGGYK